MHRFMQILVPEDADRPRIRLMDWVIHLLFAAALLTVSLSCDECTEPACTTGALGTVEGYVFGGSSPVQIELQLVPLADSQEEDSYKVHSDSTGWYSLTAPAGDYLLKTSYRGSARFYRPDGGLGPEEQSDTLSIGGPVRRIDLMEGAISIRLDVPEALLEQVYFCDVGVNEGSRFVVRARAGGEIEGSGLRFFMPFVPAGTYQAKLRVSQGATIWLPPSWSPNDADTLTVRAGSTTDFEAALTEPATIRGAITGSWEQFSGDRPHVFLFDSDSTEIMDVRFSFSPEYEFLLPVATAVRVLVRIGSIAQWIGGAGYASATILDPQPGEIIAGVDLEESGLVCYLDYAGHFSEIEAVLQLVDADSARIGRGFSGGPSANPIYISNLNPGSHYLFLRRTNANQPWFSQWFDGAETFAQATPITIDSPGGIKQITVHLTDGGRITGRVLRFDGEPALNIPLAIRRVDGTGYENYAARSSPSDGAFEVLGLNNGEYYIGVYSYYYGVTSWYPGTFDAALADTIHIADHDTVTGIEWAVSFLGGVR